MVDSGLDLPSDERPIRVAFDPGANRGTQPYTIQILHRDEDGVNYGRRLVRNPEGDVFDDVFLIDDNGDELRLVINIHYRDFTGALRWPPQHWSHVAVRWDDTGELILRVENYVFECSGYDWTPTLVPATHPNSVPEGWVSPAQRCAEGSPTPDVTTYLSP